MAPLFTGFRLGFGRSAEVAAVPISATGGTILTPGDGYVYNVFLSPDSLVLPTSKTIDYLVVAGGGASAGAGAGGGGGGVLDGTLYSISSGTYVITVGAGATANSPSAPVTPAPTNGGNSSIGALFTSTGGGSSANYPTPGYPGGSGGGGNSTTISGVPGGTGVAGPPRQGYDGGTGYSGPQSTGGACGAGGGGAGGNGTPAPGPTGAAGAAGGPGRAVPAFPGPVIAPALPSPEQSAFTTAVGPTGLYGGGGGGNGAGGGPSPTAPGGGGRSGSTYQYGPLYSQPHTNPGFNGVSGTTYTGGGGGGAGYSSGPDAFTSGLIWGSGASGIVIIRYLA